MSDIVNEFSISIDQLQDYEFRVRFDNPEHAPLNTDEPPPLGKDSGPSPARMLAGAIGSCLTASLLFSAKRKGALLEKMHTDVKVRIAKNENRRLRVHSIDVVIDPQADAAEMAKVAEVLSTFEDFCTVTASVRQGIPINVIVKGA